MYRGGDLPGRKKKKKREDETKTSTRASFLWP
jgi:hypothetical protein